MSTAALGYTLHSTLKRVGIMGSDSREQAPDASIDRYLKAPSALRLISKPLSSVNFSIIPSSPYVVEGGSVNFSSIPSLPYVVEGGPIHSLAPRKQLASAQKARDIAHAKIAPPPPTLVAKPAVRRGNSGDSGTAVKAHGKATAQSQRPSPQTVVLESGKTTAPGVIKLQSGETLYYTTTTVGTGGFKKILQATLVSPDGKERIVAASTPFIPQVSVSRFALEMAKKECSHVISNRYIQVLKDGVPHIVTFSSLCTPEGTHYAGNSIADALVLKKPISKIAPYAGADAYKNQFRIIHGMLTGVFKYYESLFKNDKHLGRHGDIKPKNFVFDNKRNEVVAGPYCTIKLIDLPEDPEADVVPLTPGFFLKGLNRHARDLHALRVCFLHSLYSSFKKPLFVGDTGTISTRLTPAQKQTLNKAFNSTYSIISNRSTHTGTIDEKEQALHQNLQTVGAVIREVKQRIPQEHYNVVGMLINTINFLNQGIKAIRQTRDYKQSQNQALIALNRAIRALERQLPNSGVTGSPMKPRVAKGPAARKAKATATVTAVAAATVAAASRKNPRAAKRRLKLGAEKNNKIAPEKRGKL